MKTPSNSKPPAAGEAEHTPNPSRWQADGDMISAPTGNIADCCDAETAAFIVRACNSHAATLAALESVAAQFDSIASALAQGHTVSISSVQNCAAAARAALQSAKE